MTDERFDKLLNVMLDIKETVDSIEKRVKNLEVGQKQILDRLDRLEDNIDLLAQKQWNNEKDIYRIKKTIGVE